MDRQDACELLSDLCEACNLEASRTYDLYGRAVCKGCAHGEMPCDICGRPATTAPGWSNQLCVICATEPANDRELPF